MLRRPVSPSKGTAVAPTLARESRAEPRVGDILRHWRAVRALSQLELSVQCGITQKHISFVESGRSLPSRPLLMKLGQALGIPLRERNDLLFAAGYAPAYASEPLGEAALQGVRRALERMLRQH